MHWIDFESLRLPCPDFTDIFVWSEPLEGFEPLGEVVGQQEGVQVLLELVMAFIMIAFDRCVLDRPVHPLDLSICPRVIDFGQPVFDFVFIADTVEDMPEGVFVPGLVGELDAIVGQNRVDRVGDGFDKVA